MKALPQVRSSAYLPFVAFLERTGESVERGAEGGLIPAVAYRDPEALVPIHLAHSYLERGARSLDLDDFGILVGAQMTVAELGAFGRSLQRSLTLHDALNKFHASYDLFSSAEHIWWTKGNEDAYFLHQYTCVTGRGSRHARHCALLLMRDVVRMAAGKSWQPERVLTTDRGDIPALQAAFHDAEIRFAKASGIAIPFGLLSLPLRHVNAARFHDEGAFGDLVPSNNFVGSLRQVIATFMAEGKCRLEDVAPAVGLHPRALQRRLAASGQDYSEILSEVRFEAALRLMADPDLRVFDIALALGFQDPPNFSRCFRQWTGITPSRFRETSIAR